MPKEGRGGMVSINSFLFDYSTLSATYLRIRELLQKQTDWLDRIFPKIYY